MRKIIFLSILLAGLSATGKAGEIPSGIISAFSAGNSGQLSQYFGATLELTMFEEEEIYSKTQAQIILRDFFEKNKPQSFQIIHQGGKESSQYAIGIMKTGTDSFRITFLLKKDGDSVYIHQLRIQHEN